jgi:tetratricopeptide (TPR) repeat protein
VKLPIIDLGVLAKYLLPATIVAGIVVYLFVRSIIVYFWQATHKEKVQKKVGQLRKAQAKPNPVVVRKTDLFAQLTSEQKKIYMRAMELADLQQVVDAAKMLESIQFQRKAIDLLETNGYIDEACGILLRMNVPYRAAVLYERNGQHLKAGEYFLRDNKPEQAARCFEKIAEKDYNFFRRAADCYRKAGLIDSALTALARLDASSEILALALEHQRYEFLHRYLDLPFHAQALLTQMEPVQLQGMIRALALTPQGALTLSHWTMYRPDESMVLGSLQKLGKHKELAKLFWARLDEGFCDFICGLLPSVKILPAAELLQMHAEVLEGLGRLSYAARMRVVAGANADSKVTTIAIGL